MKSVGATGFAGLGWRELVFFRNRFRVGDTEAVANWGHVIGKAVKDKAIRKRRFEEEEASQKTESGARTVPGELETHLFTTEYFDTLMLLANAACKLLALASGNAAMSCGGFATLCGPRVDPRNTPDMQVAGLGSYDSVTAFLAAPRPANPNTAVMTISRLFLAIQSYDAGDGGTGSAMREEEEEKQEAEAVGFDTAIAGERAAVLLRQLLYRSEVEESRRPAELETNFDSFLISDAIIFQQRHSIAINRTGVYFT
ncbi:hypothetical protein AK812_SmicGene17107 [Symbiodinium microadriaticum]|uniref:Uncharacterized protein n=1 Tax=Symbiodinium microadriaticum TaxID=2951 RepID=A0A1Q9DYL0_SYMMI|nr:hypothetical protein AK812_SmicGene17107 [Symbiodinium microadriaticum]